MAERPRDKEIDRAYPIVTLTTHLGKKRLRIHEGLAKAQSSLTTQIHTEKNGLTNFITNNECLLSPRRLATTRAGVSKAYQDILPALDLGSRDPVEGAAASISQHSSKSEEHDVTITETRHLA